MSWFKRIPTLRRVLRGVRARARRVYTLKTIDPEKGESDLAQVARRMLLDGDYRGAEVVLRKILRTSPRAPTATYLAGVAILLQGRFVEARRYIDRAYALRPWVDDRLAARFDLQTLAEVAAAHPDWDWPPYQIARERWRAIDLTIEAAVSYLHDTTGEPQTFVQIGANDGKRGDPMHRLIRNLGLEGLLVEPQPIPFARLVSNYAGVEGLRFENAAVAEADGPIEMTTTDRSSLGTMVPDRNILKLRARRDLRRVTVDGRTFDSILKTHEIDRFDILQIDTEGFDYRVLRQVDLRLRDVKVVNMEYYCLHVSERVAACRQLSAAGFSLFFGPMDLLAVRREVFEARFAITDRMAA